MIFGSAFHVGQAYDDYDRSSDDEGYGHGPGSEGYFNKECVVVAETEKAVCITGVATDSTTGKQFVFEQEWFPKSLMYGQYWYFKLGAEKPQYAMPPIVKNWLWRRKAKVELK